MKNTLIFVASLFALLLFVTLGCDKSSRHEHTIIESTDDDVETMDPNTVLIDETIQSRAVDSCAQCFAHTDCCCGIELLSAEFPNTNATIYLCGTFDGTDNCSGKLTGCPTYGGGQSAFLDLVPPEDPKVLFCMEHDSILCITNTEPFDITIFVTCEYGITNPDSDSPVIAANSTICYAVDDECHIDACP